MTSGWYWLLFAGAVVLLLVVIPWTITERERYWDQIDHDDWERFQNGGRW